MEALDLEAPEVKEALQKAVDEQVAGLKAKNAELLGKLQKVKTVPDVDVDEYNRLKDDADKRAEEEARKRGEFDKLLQQTAEKHQQEKQQLSEAMEQYKARLHQNLIEAESLKAISKERGIPELLMPHLRDRVRVTEQGGELSLEVLDAKGQLMVTDAGERASVNDLVAELKANEVFGRAFESQMPGGTGSRPNASTDGGVVNPWKAETLNLTNQGRILKENPALAEQMKRAAGKA